MRPVWQLVSYNHILDGASSGSLCPLQRLPIVLRIRYSIIIVIHNNNNCSLYGDTSVNVKVSHCYSRWRCGDWGISKGVPAAPSGDAHDPYKHQVDRNC